MAAGAQNFRFGELGDDGRRVFDVFGLGTVAGFAADVGVFSFAFDLNLVGMADLTGLASGELHGARTDVVHSTGAEVTIFAELGRYYPLTNEQEGNDRKGEQDGDADEMFRAPEEVPHTAGVGKLLSRRADWKKKQADGARCVGKKALGVGSFLQKTKPGRRACGK